MYTFKFNIQETYIGNNIITIFHLFIILRQSQTLHTNNITDRQII